MKNEINYKVYTQMIKELDEAHEQELKSQLEITGNNLERYNETGRRMKIQSDYEYRRKALEELQADALGVSPAVEAYLKPEIPVSKFEVEKGNYTIDNSLNTLGGKKL